MCSKKDEWFWFIVCCGWRFLCARSNCLCNHYYRKVNCLNCFYSHLFVMRAAFDIKPQVSRVARPLTLWSSVTWQLRMCVLNTINLPVFSCCKQRRNFISQSQWLLVKGCWLHKPRLHSPGDNVLGQRSCSRQQRSSSAYLPTSLYSVAIEPLDDWNQNQNRNDSSMNKQ